MHILATIINFTWSIQSYWRMSQILITITVFQYSTIFGILTFLYYKCYVSSYKITYSNPISSTYKRKKILLPLDGMPGILSSQTRIQKRTIIFVNNNTWNLAVFSNRQLYNNTILIKISLSKLSCNLFFMRVIKYVTYFIYLLNMSTGYEII